MKNFIQHKGGFEANSQKVAKKFEFAICAKMLNLMKIQNF